MTHIHEFWLWVFGTGASIVGSAFVLSMFRSAKVADRSSPWKYDPRNDVVFLTGPRRSIVADAASVEMSLNDSGRKVLMSADLCGSTRPTHDEIRNDILSICCADCVAVLPLWRCYGRPRLHVAIAQAIGKPVVYADTLKPVPAQHRRLFVQDLEGACECGREEVIERVGELWGKDIEKLLRRD